MWLVRSDQCKGGYPQHASSGSAISLSLEEIDRIAKRYAMWEVRRKFDWGQYSPDISEATRTIDTGLYRGMYELDVTLRRQVEELLRSRGEDKERADHVRTLVAAKAGALAADLDLRHLVSDQYHKEWDVIAEYFDLVCDDLDALLSLAGSPPIDSA